MACRGSTRTDGVVRLELYGDATVTGGVLRLTDLIPGFSHDDVIIDDSRDEDAVRRRGSPSQLHLTARTQPVPRHRPPFGPPRPPSSPSAPSSNAVAGAAGMEPRRG